MTLMTLINFEASLEEVDNSNRTRREEREEGRRKGGRKKKRTQFNADQTHSSTI